jgi:membrane protein
MGYQMQQNKPWTRQKLTQMLYHAFIGSLADNAIEIGWVLCFSLLADKSLVERITVLFGVNDAFWVILSSTYYTARTSMTATLPKLIKKYGLNLESKVVKNHIYLFYLMLLPSAIGSFLFLPKLLVILGVSPTDLPFYLPYFQLSIISILIAAPWATFIPTYLRTRGRSKEAMALDHAIAWSMLIGIFFTTHVLHLGVNTALIVNMITNAIPLYWFLWKRPIPQFFSKGFEFSWTEIKSYWVIVKWELVRRLAPRVSAIIGVGLTITINPIFAGIKYWISNLMMLPEGWVDSMAGLLNSHVSRNVGLGEEIPYKDNKFVFWKAVVGMLLSVISLYFLVYLGLTWLPESLYKGIISPIVWFFLPIELISRLRYYMWLSVSRSYRHDLNGVAQLIYAIPTAIITPVLLWLFLHYLQLGFESIFAVGAIVALVQWVCTEIYFRYKLKI